MISVVPTSDAWVQAALADLPTLLLDHAHCEKKAASTAVRFLFRYPDWPRLCAQMSRLAREELVHFDRVVAELRVRNIALRALQASGYAAALFELVQNPVDELLCCALIEARSHERFGRLVQALPDHEARLRDLYVELADAESRHGGIYVELAEERAGAPLDARLAELVVAEGDIVARPGRALRMHSG